MDEKPFKNYSEQLEILKSRGLKLIQNGVPLRTLAEENYYNLINGYKCLFLDPTSTEEKYKDGAEFVEIVALYRFDKEVRYILLKELLKIENKLRSLISYTFSEKYGNNNYLKFDNFESLRDSGITKSKIEKRAGHIHELIASLQKDLASAIDKKEYVKHYMNKYGCVPFWVFVNCLTFGTVSRFYSLMKPAEQNSVAKYFGIKESSLIQYINIMANFRNLCAHDERLYNVRMDRTLNLPNTKWHSFIGISTNEQGRYEYGINDFFSLIIILRELLPRKEFNSFYVKLNGQIRILSLKLKSITIADVYKEMGFPPNWRKITKSPRPA